MATYAEQLANGSPIAAATARRLGAEGRPGALAALASPAAATRRAAVGCLEAIADSRDLDALAALVADSDPTVALTAAAAVRNVYGVARGRGSVVLAAFDASAEPRLRVELAFALGEGIDVPLDVLRKRHAAEEKAPVKRALSAACARRGDQAHLRALTRELERAKGPTLEEPFERCEYVRRTELLPALVRLLDDAARVAPGWPEGRWVRVCDQAAWAIATILGGHFAAAASDFTELGPAELDEVRARAEATLDELRARAPSA